MATLRFLNAPPWYFLLPALLVGMGVFIPLAYLLVRALEADPATVSALVFRSRNLRLFFNTTALAAGVLLLSTLIALPLAWLTTHTTLRGRRFFTLLGVLPLAFPSYVMAYALLGLGGAYGTAAQLFGVALPRLSGYPGALLAISFYATPYLFLNLRAGLVGLDPALVETARALGHRPASVFFRVVLPQLRPGFLAGALLIGLHVLGDFGAVSLMRFETFSYAIYLQYSAAYDRVYAALLALMLLAMTGLLLALEARSLRRVHLYRTGTGSAKPLPPVPLGRWRGATYGFVALVAAATVVVPLSTILFWMIQGLNVRTLGYLGLALFNSTLASAPAAVLATSFALPLAYLSLRFPTRLSRSLERAAYLGYATPPLALALAFVFFTLRTAPALYQTFALLIIAYVTHYIAEAVGPIRSALYQAPPRLEEAARSLGQSAFGAFVRVTLPLLRSGLIISTAFVFLAAMKELPITFLLSPAGFDTLALRMWGYTNEALFGQAAPFALAIVLVSVAFVGLLLTRDNDP